MKRSRFSPLALSFILLLWIVPPHTRSQDTPQEQEKKFFDVSLGPDDIYRYSNLKFSGDYTSFESPSGMLALGRTEAGVTVVIVLGGGTLHIECPDALQDKLKGAFGSYPLVTGFQTLYLRLHPKEFDEAFGGIQMTKVADTQAMAMAQAIYDERFLTSYHAGQKAIFPPYKTRVMDFDTAAFGLITNEEGYWITLRKIVPYASIYPARFVNPKQK